MSRTIYICHVLDLLPLGKFVRKLLGRNDIEDALKRLDTLTMEEVRMAIAETLNVTHQMDDKVTVLVDGRLDTFSGYPRIPEH